MRIILVVSFLCSLLCSAGMIVWSMIVSKQHIGVSYSEFPGADRLILFTTGVSIICTLLLLDCIVCKLGAPSTMLGADIELVPCTA